MSLIPPPPTPPLPPQRQDGETTFWQRCDAFVQYIHDLGVYLGFFAPAMSSLINDATAAGEGTWDSDNAPAANVFVRTGDAPNLDAWISAAGTDRPGLVALASNAGQALGTAAAGTSARAAREDHVHPLDGLTTRTLCDARMSAINTALDDIVGTQSAHTARTDNPHEVTAAQVGAARVADRVLPGSVIAFSGEFGGTDNRHPIPRGGTIPDTGWLLCDGGDDGSGGTVPDLRGRMILGASTTYATDSTGGAETHTHSVSGSVGATTLTQAQMPSHCHTYPWYNNSGGGPAGVTNNTTLYQSAVASSYTGGNGSHTHSLSVSSGAASSLPPYYALAYIIRL